MHIISHFFLCTLVCLTTSVFAMEQAEGQPPVADWPGQHIERVDQPANTGHELRIKPNQERDHVPSYRPVDNYSKL